MTNTRWLWFWLVMIAITVFLQGASILIAHYRLDELESRAYRHQVEVMP